MRTSIATVCLSGTLVEKLHAAARPGSTASRSSSRTWSPRRPAPRKSPRSPQRLGLSLDLYQPFRDAEGVAEHEFAAVLRRARAKFELMQRLGIDTMLVCSNVGTATVDDDAVSAGAAAPAGRGGRGPRRPAGVRSARLGAVRRRLPTRVADRRARRPPGRRGVPRQLPHPVARPRPRRDRADPRGQDLLPAAGRRARADHGRPLLEPAPPALPRRGRLRPEAPSSATSSPPATPDRCPWRSSTTPSGRPTSVRTADQAKRSLTWLEDQVAHLGRAAGRADQPAPAARRRPTGRLRLRRGQGRGHRRGRRPPPPARLHLPRPPPHQAGAAVDPGPRPRGVQRAAGTRPGRRPWPPSASRCADPAASAERARRLDAPTVFRRTRASEQELPAFRAPDGTEVFLAGLADGTPPGCRSSRAARPSSRRCT